MKLVDILARELKVWPEGLECLSQLKGAGYIINGKGFDGRAFDTLSIADETRIAGAIVTRAEWQAAVDALKVAEGIADAEAGNLISLDDVKDKWQGKTERAQVLPSGAGHWVEGGVVSTFTLKARSLFDKNGFVDGDIFSDLLLDNDIDPDLGRGEWDSLNYSLEDRLLLAVVEKYLLPAIPEKLEPRLWHSCHNPVRCEGWAGAIGRHIPASCRSLAVEVPEAEVLAMARVIEGAL